MQKDHLPAAPPLLEERKWSALSRKRYPMRKKVQIKKTRVPALQPVHRSHVAKKRRNQMLRQRPKPLVAALNCWKMTLPKKWTKLPERSSFLILMKLKKGNPPLKSLNRKNQNIPLVLKVNRKKRSLQNPKKFQMKKRMKIL